jgi:L,D-transpeptidase catalytic domain
MKIRIILTIITILAALLTVGVFAAPKTNQLKLQNGLYQPSKENCKYYEAMIKIYRGTPGKGQFLMNCGGWKVIRTFPVITAAKSYTTFKGSFYIDYTSKVEYLNNPKYGYTKLKTPYWMEYNGPSYAIHGAPWRASGEFSGSVPVVDGGSHGCTNVTVEDAKYLFEQIPKFRRVKVINY